MAAPSAGVRQSVLDRDLRRCVTCGATEALQFQHRRAVGMGGSKIKPAPVDGLVLCAVHNQAAEGNAKFQKLALIHGWKVARWVGDPASVPVWYQVEGRWCRLVGVRRVEVSAAVALQMMRRVYGSAYDEWRGK